MTLMQTAASLHGDIAELRHHLHRNPELELDLPHTQSAVLDALSDLGLELTLGKGCSSVTAVLRGTKTVADADRRTVLLRGDMDALPLTEEVDVPFRSDNSGVMHACGHDLHTSMLVGAARTLHRHRDELPGDVIFMFQPGEEGFDGAGIMLAEGVLDAAGRRPDAAWALHVFSNLSPRGHVLSRPQALMASCSELEVVVHGKGGHGSAPHQAQDPIPAVLEIASGLQTRVSRSVSAFEPAVITVGCVQAGTKANIIPERGFLGATIRCFSAEVLDIMEREVVRYATNVAAAHGLSASVDFDRQYPVTVNDASAVTIAQDVVQQKIGQHQWQTMDHPIAGAEDFSRVLQAVPGAMLFLGASTEDQDWAQCPGNHSAFANFSDDVLSTGAGLYAELALRTLTRPD